MIGWWNFVGNRLLETFLIETENKQLYNSYLEHSTALKREMLERRFKYHVKKIRIFSYFVKTLHFESKRFDMKIRKLANQNPLILDNAADESGRNLLDLIESDISFEKTQESYTLEEIIEDKKLYSIVSALSDKQKVILELIYVKALHEETIASQLGITKQAVNKTKKTALNKIRQQYI